MGCRCDGPVHSVSYPRQKFLVERGVVDIMFGHEHLEERIENLERRYGWPCADMGNRDDGFVWQLNAIRDLICKHEEVYCVKPRLCGMTMETGYYCKRCNRKLDPAKVGVEELEKRVKARGSGKN